MAALAAATEEIEAARQAQEKAAAAAEAAVAAAKRRWARSRDESGNTLWYDVDTQETTFERPDDYHSDEDVEVVRAMQGHGPTLPQRKLRGKFRNLADRIVRVHVLLLKSPGALLSLVDTIVKVKSTKSKRKTLANVVHAAYDHAKDFAEKVRH